MAYYGQPPPGALTYDAVAEWERNGTGFWHGVYTVLGWVWELTPAQWDILPRAFLFAFLLTVLPGVAIRTLQNAFRPRAKNTFGEARFATAGEIEEAGMFRPGGRFLGQWRDVRRWWRLFLPGRPRDLYLHGESHALTIAAQGAGKTSGIIIPTLLTYLDGSVVVTDPKGAITAQMARFRGMIGEVVVLNPWRQELMNDPSFALDLGDDGFNPMQLVDATPDGQAAARLLASLLLPDPPRVSDPYFTMEGRAMLEWGMLWLALTAKPEQQTLCGLHDLILDFAELQDCLQLAAKQDKIGPGWRTVRTIGSHFAGMTGEALPQLTGIVGSASTALRIYSPETLLGEHVNRTGGFKLADIKGEFPITVFLICPPNHLIGDDRKWLNLVVALIAQEVGRPGMARETVMLIDEFPALGYLPNLAGAFEQFREAGLRGHLIAQNPGQILNVYGSDYLSRFWGMSELKQFSRFTDYEHAKNVSGWCGERTVVSASTNARGETTVSEVGVPIIRASDLTGMGRNRQIILRTGMPPIAATLMPYFQRPDWAQFVDPNPYLSARRKG